MNSAGDLFIPVHSHLQEYSLRTEPSGFRHWLSTVDTESSCLIRSRRNNSSKPGAATYDYGFAFELRIVHLLYRGKESININMEYLSSSH